MKTEHLQRHPLLPPLTIGNRHFAWGERTYVMGVLNITPDSFSGDGVDRDTGAALEQALRFQQWGADIVDVGAESTRPASVYAGAEPTPEDVELERLLPVLRGICPALDIPVSVDTYKAGVARAAISEGAAMINDVWGLTRDPGMPGIIETAASTGAPVVIMHNRERGAYGPDVVTDVASELREAVDAGIGGGIEGNKIIVDPGFGFGGKSPAQNLELLRRLSEIRDLGRPVLVGTSRKSTIGRVLDLPVDERLEGTAATVALAIANGADIVRVHDVKEMVRVARMSDAIVRGWSPTP